MVSGIQNRKCTDNFNIIGDVSILDTRKTTPGLRSFEKYAVRVGGWAKPTSKFRFGRNDDVGLAQTMIIDVFKRAKAWSGFSGIQNRNITDNFNIIGDVSILDTRKPLQAFALCAKTVAIIVWAKPTLQVSVWPKR